MDDVMMSGGGVRGGRGVVAKPGTTDALPSIPTPRGRHNACRDEPIRLFGDPFLHRLEGQMPPNGTMAQGRNLARFERIKQQ